jgi:hypothetical protein
VTSSKILWELANTSQKRVTSLSRYNIFSKLVFIIIHWFKIECFCILLPIGPLCSFLIQFTARKILRLLNSWPPVLLSRKMLIVKMMETPVHKNSITSFKITHNKLFFKDRVLYGRLFDCWRFRLWKKTRTPRSLLSGW